MPCLLEVEAIEAFYGSSQALFGISFDVRQGECVSLLGRNGMGKTTTIKTIMGLVAARRGRCTSMVRRSRGVRRIRLPSGELVLCRKAGKFSRPYRLGRILSLPPLTGQRDRHSGTSSRSTRCSPDLPSGSSFPPRGCLEVSSRCWQSVERS